MYNDRALKEMSKVKDTTFIFDRAGCVTCLPKHLFYLCFVHV